MGHVIIVLYRVFIPWHLPGFLSPDVDVTAPNVRGLTTNQMQSSLTSPVVLDLLFFSLGLDAESQPWETS